MSRGVEECPLPGGGQQSNRFFYQLYDYYLWLYLWFFVPSLCCHLRGVRKEVHKSFLGGWNNAHPTPLWTQLLLRTGPGQLIFVVNAFSNWIDSKSRWIVLDFFFYLLFFFLPFFFSFLSPIWMFAFDLYRIHSDCRSFKMAAILSPSVKFIPFRFSSSILEANFCVTVENYIDFIDLVLIKSQRH